MILAELVKFDMAQAADAGFLRTLNFYPRRFDAAVRRWPDTV